ncbi:MAG: response regulator, partial [Candidatus Latescibacteria bacterium]|nr:response regulator [Candidatus Latescibacterota bacterium]
PDLILLDIMMPKMNGYEVCRRLKEGEETRLIPVVMITALKETADRVKGLEAGADDFLSKPFDPTELQARVRSLLRVKSLYAELVQSEKMASLGKLVAGVAHEVNNPINFIYSNIHPLQGYVHDLKALVQLYEEKEAGLCPEDRKAVVERKEAMELNFLFEDLGKILQAFKDGATRVRDIVSSLTTFSRPDAGKPGEVDIHKGIENTLTLLITRYKERVAVHREYGDIPKVVGCAGPLNQVFMNLLANAGDAIELGKKGNVWIRTRMDGTDHVLISIRDDGKGIPKEDLDKIFDPFFTTKKVGEGTGLGLSITYGLVEKHGGRIWTESEEGKGSTFFVRLPVDGDAERP